MYTLDAFTVSCPADQDILSHYKMQQGTKMSRREELETPTFTNDVPAMWNILVTNLQKIVKSELRQLFMLWQTQIFGLLPKLTPLPSSNT